ncbi:hypothetical protein KP509_36G008000 [Ceratopteris richardii]|nr:hypothetical protein KP509_36G008000 [Ceratopteris richardii]
MAILDLKESKQTEAVARQRVWDLLEEKSLLEKRIKLKHDSWSLEKRSLKEALASARKENKRRSIVQAFEIAALRVSLGSCKQEALIFKLRLEGAVDEVEILSSRLKILNVLLQEKDVKFHEAGKKHIEIETQLKQRLDAAKSVDAIQQKAIDVSSLTELRRKHELEIQKLKKEKHIMSLKRKEEVSSLLKEKNFAWGQFKMMEDNYSLRLDVKRQELKCAEDALKQLEVMVDELQKAHDEKTAEVSTLQLNLRSAEEELLKLRDDISKLIRYGQDAYLTCCPSRNVLSKSITNIGEQRTMCSGDKVAKLLAEKEAALMKARKSADELRLENHNLLLLYADLEERLKAKQNMKQKPPRENMKDPAYRNLSADLEACAVNSVQRSPDACAELKRRKVLAIQGETFQEDASNAVEPSSKERNDELMISEQSHGRLLQQSVSARSDSMNNTRSTNSLFKLAFNVPKVIAGK